MHFATIVCCKKEKYCVLCSVAEFATRGDMKNAITKLDRTDLFGRKIKIIEDRHYSSRRRRLAKFIQNILMFTGFNT